MFNTLDSEAPKYKFFSWFWGFEPGERSLTLAYVSLGEMTKTQILHALIANAGNQTTFPRQIALQAAMLNFGIIGWYLYTGSNVFC